MGKNEQFFYSIEDKDAGRPGCTSNYHFKISQVLSESVSKALLLGEGGSRASETSKFVLFMDKFFDALNVHNYTHGVPFQMPYTSPKLMTNA